MATAEEGEWMEKVARRYTPAEYLDVMTWSTAHEIGHLLVKGQDEGPDWSLSGHLVSPANVLMSNSVLAPEGISSICADEREIRAVNLVTRKSVKTRDE